MCLAAAKMGHRLEFYTLQNWGCKNTWRRFHIRRIGLWLQSELWMSNKSMPARVGADSCSLRFPKAEHQALTSQLHTLAYI